MGNGLRSLVHVAAHKRPVRMHLILVVRTRLETVHIAHDYRAHLIEAEK